jgi:hypothetical protein
MHEARCFHARDDQAMPPSALPALVVLPGRLIVTFLVRVGCAGAALVVVPGQFLEGLKAARNALGFAELLREDERLDELLPWAGNV